MLSTIQLTNWYSFLRFVASNAIQLLWSVTYNCTFYVPIKQHSLHEHRYSRKQLWASSKCSPEWIRLPYPIFTNIFCHVMIQLRHARVCTGPTMCVNLDADAQKHALGVKLIGWPYTMNIEYRIQIYGNYAVCGSFKTLQYHYQNDVWQCVHRLVHSRIDRKIVDTKKIFMGHDKHP